MEVQARTNLFPKNGIGVYLVLAGAERIIGVEEIQEIVRICGGTVRPEIPGPVLPQAPGQEHPRIGLRRDAYPGIGLGVLQQYVVLGLILLDEIVLEQQGVGLGIDHRILHVGNLRYQDAGLGVEPLRRH